MRPGRSQTRCRSVSSLREGAGRFVKALGVVGWSGSGKTTLLTAMLPLLRARGLTVSTVKHTHHGFDMDRSGKDTFRHREAGAHEVLVASGARWALLHEVAGPEPSLPELLQRMDPVDLVLVEGYKAHPFPKVEVHRPALGKPPIWPENMDVVAVATDGALPDCDRKLLPLNDPSAVVVAILGLLALEPATN
jgi:molybdopterin-guanine dinucleotide biosynthesis adapter protein